jgi:hypothetical protein
MTLDTLIIMMFENNVSDTCVFIQIWHRLILLNINHKYTRVARDVFVITCSFYAYKTPFYFIGMMVHVSYHVVFIPIVVHYENNKEFNS